VLEKKFLKSLAKLDDYLLTPLAHELDKNPKASRSSRAYLDGDTLTLADCNLLPKLNIVKVGRRARYSGPDTVGQITASLSLKASVGFFRRVLGSEQVGRPNWTSTLYSSTELADIGEVLEQGCQSKLHPGSA